MEDPFDRPPPHPPTVRWTPDSTAPSPPPSLPRWQGGPCPGSGFAGPALRKRGPVSLAGILVLLAFLLWFFEEKRPPD